MVGEMAEDIPSLVTDLKGYKGWQKKVSAPKKALQSESDATCEHLTQLGVNLPPESSVATQPQSDVKPPPKPNTITQLPEPEEFKPDAYHPVPTTPQREPTVTWTVEDSRTHWAKCMHTGLGSGCWNPYEGVKPEVADLIEKHTRPNPGFVAMDYGCYDGKWIGDLIDLSNSGRVIAVDIIGSAFNSVSDRWLAYADKNHCELDFYLTNGTDLRRLDDESVDFILSIDAIVRTSAKDTSKLILEFYRVLKHSGSAVVQISHEYYNHIRKDKQSTELISDIIKSKLFRGPCGLGTRYIIIKKDSKSELE